MRRLIPSLALALALLAAGTVRSSDARVDINLRIGRPAPVVVFDQEPDVVLVPGTRVYYVEGQPYDLYRYGAYWYICDDGYWYRARNYRGPFASVDIGFVPRSIVSVPPRFHRYPVRAYGGPRYRGDWNGRDRGWGEQRGWDHGGRPGWNGGDHRGGDRDRGDHGDRGHERGDRR